MRSITKDELQKLKKKLHKGWVKEVSETLCVSKEYVRLVSNGVCYNLAVIREMVRLAKQQQMDEDALLNELKSIIEE